MNSVTIKLGEQSYKVEELPSRKNAEWREKLSEPFQGLAGILANSASIELNKAENLPQIAEIIKLMVSRAAGSVDIMTDLLFDYAPALKKDRAKILDTCYDSEIMNAFMQVITLAYPFGGIARIVRDLSTKVGQETPQISQN